MLWTRAYQWDYTDAKGVDTVHEEIICEQSAVQRLVITPFNPIVAARFNPVSAMTSMSEQPPVWYPPFISVLCRCSVTCDFLVICVLKITAPLYTVNARFCVLYGCQTSSTDDLSWRLNGHCAVLQNVDCHVHAWQS